jgi:hypothetical protein
LQGVAGDSPRTVEARIHGLRVSKGIGQ